MLLITAIIVILFEAIIEGLVKRYSPTISDIIFKWWIQWLIAIGLFVIWLLFALWFNCKGFPNSSNICIPIWKIIIGFIFVRFLIFDTAWNIARGVKWNYYGTTKLYDRIMKELDSWGFFMKIICGIIGICFLMGIE
jgi:hypothetical protein